MAGIPRQLRNADAAIALALQISLYFSLLAGNLERRPVRIGLRRQPPSPGSRDIHHNFAKKPTVCGLLASGGESPCSQSGPISGRRTQNLRAFPALFPFSGATSRRPGSIALRCPGACYSLPLLSVRLCTLAPRYVVPELVKIAVPVIAS